MKGSSARWLEFDIFTNLLYIHVGKQNLLSKKGTTSMYYSVYDRVHDFFEENRIAQVIVALLAIVAVVAAIIAGFGLFSIVLLVVLVALTMYFGSIKELAGAATLAVLLKMFGGTIHALVAVWLAGPKLTQFFSVVQSTDLIALIFTSFFFFYFVSFGTGCIQPKLFKIETTVNNKKSEQE